MSSTEFLVLAALSPTTDILSLLNFPDSRIGTRVTYCASLDDDLCVKLDKFEISLKTQENILVCLNLWGPSCRLMNESGEETAERREP